MRLRKWRRPASLALGDASAALRRLEPRTRRAGQPSRELGAPAAAEAQARAVAQDNFRIAPEERGEALSLLDRSSRSSSDGCARTARVEPCLEIREPLPEEVGVAAGVQLHVVVGAANPVHAIAGHEQRLLAAAHHEALQVWTARRARAPRAGSRAVPRATGPCRLELRLHSREHLHEPPVVERLHEVVERVHLEGLQRVPGRTRSRTRCRDGTRGRWPRAPRNRSCRASARRGTAGRAATR